MRLASLILPLLAWFATPAQDWRSIQPGVELSFPGDHGAHPEYQTEWWYLTGQVESESGRRFGYQFTVFRRGLSSVVPRAGDSAMRARQVLLGHFAITDIDRERTLFAERQRRTGTPLTRMRTDNLDLVVEDWSLMRQANGGLQLDAGDALTSIAIDFDLLPAKPLVLHGENGYSAKGKDPSNASAYTSWTRIETRGLLTIEGESFRVSGESWFDHEFGSSVLEAGVDGWDWFGLHLDDGRDLMLFLLRREDGRTVEASAGTLVETDGSAHRLRSSDFRITPLATWSSPTTEAIYPARWLIEVPSRELRCEVVPLVADCELSTKKTTGVVYWEGPVELRGSVTGRGYAELTGYAGTMSGKL